MWRRPRLHRLVHVMAEIPHSTQGIRGLYSEKGLDTVWFKYQKMILDELNEAVRGKAAEALTLFEITQQCKHDPDLRRVNYLANQAYTNEFFIFGLRDSANQSAQIAKVDPDKPEYRSVDTSTHVKNDLPNANSVKAVASPERLLCRAVEASFDNLASLRELLINRAHAIFGNGAVWLLSNTPFTRLYVVNTYGWGTPFSHAGKGQAFVAGDHHAVQPATDLHPLLCFNVWQHAYVPDYGVFGKRRYLENLFDCIDWSRVLSRAPAKQQPVYSGKFDAW